MSMKRIITSFCLLILLFFLSTSYIKASIFFQDDFSNGLEKWIPTRDNGSKWFVSSERAGAIVTSAGEVTELVPKDEYWNNSIQTYSVEFDITPIQGQDKNFTLRYLSNSDFYELHFNANGLFLDRTVPQNSGSIAVLLNNNVTSHIKVDYLIDEINVYVNGNLVFEFDDPSNPYSNGKIGIKVGTGLAGTTEVYFDNIVVTSLDPSPTPSSSPTQTPSPSPTPSPTASPTPTSTPTPTPTPILTPTPVPSPTPSGFPYFSQLDPVWKNTVYDSATSWNPLDPSFGRWGCAVSSAAMILKYHGIITLPNGLATTPGNLNTWLITEPNGYIGNGLVNWSMISKISRIMNLTNPTWPKLEFSFGSNSIPSLASNLQAGKPTILFVNTGHFITAYNYTSPTDIDIADPAYLSRTKLSAYNNTFVSSRQFTPSFTDLSHLTLYTDSQISSKLEKKSAGSFRPVQNVVMTTEKLQGAPNGSLSGAEKKILDLAKPPAGEYRLTLTRSGSGFHEPLFLRYTEDGTEHAEKLPVFIDSSPLTYLVTLSSSGSASIQKTVGFGTLKDDIGIARSSGMTRLKYKGTDLIEILEASEKAYKKNKKLSKTLFELYQLTLKYRELLFEQKAFSLIQSDTKLAKDQLF